MEAERGGKNKGMRGAGTRGRWIGKRRDNMKEKEQKEKESIGMEAGSDQGGRQYEKVLRGLQGRKEPFCQL